jgi:hypothetical protein
VVTRARVAAGAAAYDGRCRTFCQIIQSIYGTKCGALTCRGGRPPAHYPRFIVLSLAQLRRDGMPTVVPAQTALAFLVPAAYSGPDHNCQVVIDTAGVVPDGSASWTEPADRAA